MSNKSKLISISTGLILLAGCGSYYKKPESIESKMARYESKKEYINKIPEYTVNSPIKASRNPASANEYSEQINESNLSIYFLSLYEQNEIYNALFPDQKNIIKNCPTFHQELLKREASSYSYSLKEDIDYTKNSIVNSLSANAQLSKSTLASAMTKLMKGTIAELKSLCEYGQSDNYYIYENFITLSSKANKFPKNTDTVNSLLKTTIFYNQALISSISNKEKIKVKSRGLASTAKPLDYSEEAIRRLKASWAIESLK